MSFSSCSNCGSSAVAVPDKVVDVFFVQFIDGVDVPMIMQRRVCSLGHSRWHARCVQRLVLGVDRAENCGGPAVAVL